MSSPKLSNNYRSIESFARLFGEDALDNRVPVATPENIAFRYEVAGPFTRMLAFLLDVLLLAFVVGISLLILVLFSVALDSFLSDFVLVALGLFMLFVFLVTWFYGTAMETWWNGRTVGKWALRLRVLTCDGRPINVIQAGVRNFLRLADLLPSVFTVVPTGGIGLLVMSLNRRFQRLGDLAAGTIVIHERRKHHQSIEEFQDLRVAQLAQYIPISFVVSNELAHALSMYVQRREYFSAERAREIAGHLAAPLLREFGLPDDTSYDLLLCSIYYRTFLLTESRKEIEWVTQPQPITQPQRQIERGFPRVPS